MKPSEVSPEAALLSATFMYSLSVLFHEQPLSEAQKDPEALFGQSFYSKTVPVDTEGKDASGKQSKQEENSKKSPTGQQASDHRSSHVSGRHRSNGDGEQPASCPHACGQKTCPACGNKPCECVHCRGAESVTTLRQGKEHLPDGLDRRSYWERYGHIFCNRPAEFKCDTQEDCSRVCNFHPDQRPFSVIGAQSLGPDHEFLTLSYHGIINTWHLQDGQWELQSEYIPEDSVILFQNALIVVIDNQVIVFGDDTLVIFERDEIGRLTGHHILAEYLTTAGVLSDQRIVTYSPRGRGLEIWRHSGGQWVATPLTDDVNPVDQIHVLSDGTFLTVSTTESSVSESSESEDTDSDDSGLDEPDVSESDSEDIIRRENVHLQLWEERNGQWTSREYLTANDVRQSFFQVLPDNRLLAVIVPADQDGHAQFWNDHTNVWEPLTGLPLGQWSIISLLSEGRICAQSSDSRVIRLLSNEEERWEASDLELPAGFSLVQDRSLTAWQNIIGLNEDQLVATMISDQADSREAIILWTRGDSHWNHVILGYSDFPVRGMASFFEGELITWDEKGLINVWTLK
ncbi:hypothetical protein [Endozoicomonas euniceicola]|uniref:WD40 repeat domain-containing protein n=1 Tax=Endozoicomonas euniceicola TaxID=1234143 RepID=A0ABY6GWU2_9GAMM|nr:hypothetical protein [Endozoicomonas euniceicola]UYM17240.1 hypothetical protein NX720_04770 [Endozoicomonas euniceicola]